MDGTAVESAFALLLTKVTKFLKYRHVWRNKIMCHIWHSNRKEVRKFMMKRTISGMIGAGSLAHNRRDFVAENVNPDRVQLNICYKNENLKEVYKELFDDAVERYNVGEKKGAENCKLL